MPDMDKEKSCCFFGHRKIDETAELKNKLCGIIENLIVNEKVDTSSSGAKVNLMTYAMKSLLT
jgi:hypothetical protein